MLRERLRLATLTATLLCSGALNGAQPPSGEIGLKDSWARPTPPVTPVNGAAYLKLVNHGDESIVLTGATADIAKKVGIHRTARENGHVHMQPVKNGLTIQPGQTLSMEPGGYNFMLMKLSSPLEQGQSFSLELSFRDRENLTVDVQVEAP